MQQPAATVFPTFLALVLLFPLHNLRVGYVPLSLCCVLCRGVLSSLCVTCVVLRGFRTCVISCTRRPLFGGTLPWNTTRAIIWVSVYAKRTVIRSAVGYTCPDNYCNNYPGSPYLFHQTSCDLWTSVYCNVPIAQSTMSCPDNYCNNYRAHCGYVLTSTCSDNATTATVPESLFGTTRCGTVPPRSTMS